MKFDLICTIPLGNSSDKYDKFGTSDNKFGDKTFSSDSKFGDKFGDSKFGDKFGGGESSNKYLKST